MHGAAELNVVRLGQQMQFEFISPAANLLGFERAPESDAEKTLLDEVTVALYSGDWLVGDALAGCESSLELLELPEFSNTGFESDDHDHDEEHEHDDDHDHDEDHEHEDSHDDDHEDEGGAHADFRVQYLFNCASPPPAQLAITAFDQYPGIENIRVQWINDAAQGFAELNAQNATLRLE